MPTPFTPKGPKRFDHQKRGLKKMIQTGGVTALLFDPGLGKTATVLDFASILALKSARGEARVLVVCPLAAVDTWVMQAEDYVVDDVNVWAEAIGGTIQERAETLASRGGAPTRTTPKRDPRGGWHGPRAAHWHRSHVTHVRCAENPRPSLIEGPDGLGNARPRLVLEVINLDTLASRARKGSGTMADVMVDAIRRFGPDMVVVDESHKIKGASSNASRLLARIPNHVKRRVILTGTVMPHSPLDVFAQWRFLEPYAFGLKLPDGTTKQATYGQFKEKYAKLGGWMGKEVVGFQNLDDMHRIMSINAVVARKEDSLDLPKTTPITVPVLLSAAEKKAYKAMADDLVVRTPDVTTVANNRLTQMMRLRQITSGYLPDSQGVIKQVGTSKIDAIRSLVRDTLTGEKRVVIFSFFTDEIAFLKEALEGMKGEAKAEVQTITGQTPTSERIRLRKRFGSDDPQRMVMLAQIKTMSLAVNELVTANHAIFASLSQQRDDLIQGQDRLNRLGQKRPVTFWYMLAPGTVDEVIMHSHTTRTSLEDSMLSHINTVHEKGLEQLPRLSFDGLLIPTTTLWRAMPRVTRSACSWADHSFTPAALRSAG